jgi:hypothetical protein
MSMSMSNDDDDNNATDNRSLCQRLADLSNDVRDLHEDAMFDEDGEARAQPQGKARCHFLLAMGALGQAAQHLDLALMEQQDHEQQAIERFRSAMGHRCECPACLADSGESAHPVVRVRCPHCGHEVSLADNGWQRWCCTECNEDFGRDTCEVVASGVQ